MVLLQALVQVRQQEARLQQKERGPGRELPGLAELELQVQREPRVWPPMEPVRPPARLPPRALGHWESVADSARVTGVEWGLMVDWAHWALAVVSRELAEHRQ